MDYLEAIRRDAERFYAVADTADPDQPVPACPNWTIADLVWHLGDCHAFWAADVELRAQSADELKGTEEPRPAAYADIVAHGRRQAARLLATLTSTPDETPVWTWALDDADHCVGFVRRHQVQETAVHRWDLEQAAEGVGSPLDVAVAVDALDEMLHITLPWGTDADRPLSGTVHLHCTDTGELGLGGEWFVHLDGRVEALHAKGDAALRGTASDLLLTLYGRLPLDRLDVVGDVAVAREFAARIQTD